ncbi:M16 family metallopeptidase [Neolewinella agarilytica]|uniref:Type IV secretion system putative lipoprotein virB7 n=1 Tax=Neolewinella agarilytica TaxID=478744 RepID=A0A1H9LQP3_9BACT|nr:pitrilysin family protein [Neolewinella agarilytica]SER13811.1 Predicted Zn-dependent peptidase [Neolewinella agarilytica]
MQRIFLGLFALLLLAGCNTPKATTDKMAEQATTPMMKDDFRAKAPAAGPAPEIKLGDFQDFKLDNGLQVVLVENHKLPRVSYQLFIDVPPHLEGAYAGAGDIMGQMLRRATSDMTKEQIDEEIDFIGASLSTSGSGAFASTISKYKSKMMGMMAKVVLDARFPETEFEKVKSDAVAGLKSQLADPDAIASRVRRVLTYGADHPFGELTTEESLNNIDLATIKKYYETYFVPNRSYLVMVGDLSRAEAEKLANENFGSWKKKDVPTPSFSMPKQPQGTVVSFVPRAGAVQSNIIISHPVELQPGTKEAIRAGIVNSILGSGFNGRLFQNLREDKGYTYGAYSSVSPSKVIGSFSANSNVRNEVTDSAVTQFMLELAKISSEPVTADELNRAKSLLNGSFGRALESPQRIASYALNTVRYGLDRDFYPTYLKKVAATSANDLLEVAREVITPQATNIIVVGDKSVAEKLASFATSGKVNFLDENGQPVEMVEMEAPSDLTVESVVRKYADAIGGMAAIEKVKNYKMTMEASVQGQTLSQTLIKDGGSKLSSQMTMMGMVMMDQRYNNGKAQMTQQGQTMPPNPEIDAAMKDQAALFPVVDLLSQLDKVKLDGIEQIDGKNVVVLAVEGATGTSRQYFDQESGLQVRTVQSQGGQTVTTDLGDYQTVGGIKLPYAMTISGAMPFAIEMKVTNAEVNAEIDQTLFELKE